MAKQQQTERAPASAGTLAEEVSKLAGEEHAKAKGELVAMAGAMPAYLEEMEGGGRGVSTDQADNTIPRIYLLQNNSPQVSRHNQDQYVDGAEPGDIWLKNAPQPIVKGGKDAEGLLFQPCEFTRCVNEWIPRNRDGTGGGFVAHHAFKEAKLIPGAQQVLVPGENPGDKPRVKWMNADRSHEYVETREHIGIAYTQAGAFPYVLSFSSTGHQTSKDWMPLTHQKRKKDGSIHDSWVALYRITTWLRSRGQQKWFQMQVSDAGPIQKTPSGMTMRTILWATPEQYRAGLALNKAFNSGDKQAAAPDANEDDEPGAHDGDAPAGGDGMKGDQIPF